MTSVRVSIVDVYVLRLRSRAPELLALRRAASTRCAGTWEAVHGHVSPGEKPVDAARRELWEETALVAERLYNASRVESFYLDSSDEVALIPVFCAVVDGGSTPRLSAEHDRFEWWPVEEARERLAWPRERRAVADVVALFGDGTAGLVEDVLRVS